MIRHAFAALAIIACAGGGTAAAADAGAPAPGALSIVGTGDAIVVLDRLAEAFHKSGTRYTVEIPDSIGSSGGIKMVGNGKSVLGRVARTIRSNEKSYGLSYRPFAKIPVAFFVNAEVGIDEIGVQQVADIFSGRITDWKDVGGPPGRIRVIRREDGDSTLSTLRRTFPGFGSLTLTPYSKTATTTQENFDAISTIAGTIGFGPMTEAAGRRIKALRIAGRSPYDDDYWSHNVLALIYRDNHLTPAAKAFLDFLGTEAARRAIRSAGAIPD